MTGRAFVCQYERTTWPTTAGNRAVSRQCFFVPASCSSDEMSHSAHRISPNATTWLSIIITASHMPLMSTRPLTIALRLDVAGSIASSHSKILHMWSSPPCSTCSSCSDAYAVSMSSYALSTPVARKYLGASPAPVPSSSTCNASTSVRKCTKLAPRPKHPDGQASPFR